MGSKQALVVDDSKSARFAVRKQLEGFGYAVETVETAEDAIVYLERQRPDVVFLDYTLPGADGFEVLRRIKKNAKTVTIPVVICSSHEGEDFVQQARSKGAVDVLRKPPDAQQLGGVLANVERAAAAFGKPAPAAPPAAKVQSIRSPEVAIEQRVMNTLREAMKPPSAAPPPPAQEGPGRGVPADVQVRKLAQDLYAQLGELKAQLAGLDGASVDPERLRDIVREEIHRALSEVREELLKAAKHAASEEAQSSAERAVMNAASRVSEQMAQSLMTTLGHISPSAGSRQK